MEEIKSLCSKRKGINLMEDEGIIVPVISMSQQLRHFKQEILKLEYENRKLKKEIEELKKQLKRINVLFMPGDICEEFLS